MKRDYFSSHHDVHEPHLQAKSSYKPRNMAIDEVRSAKKQLL